MVPQLAWLTPASSNDKDYLGQLKPQRREIYGFDKTSVNYGVYKKWTKYGSFFVSRLNKNASFDVVSEFRADIHNF